MKATNYHLAEVKKSFNHQFYIRKQLAIVSSFIGW